MFNFKNSFAAFAGVCLFVCSLATLLSPTRGQVNNPGGPPQFGPRHFYLTNLERDGSQALTACAEGYHMASLWEILDPSNLRYNTELGLTTTDSGVGPPTDNVGWVRTGFESHSNAISSPGFSNCRAWSSNSNMDYGTYVFLPPPWDTTYDATVISPWVANNSPCSLTATVLEIRVWCVQN